MEIVIAVVIFCAQCLTRCHYAVVVQVIGIRMRETQPLMRDEDNWVVHGKVHGLTPGVQHDEVPTVTCDVVRDQLALLLEDGELHQNQGEP